MGDKSKRSQHNKIKMHRQVQMSFILMILDLRAHELI